MADEEKKPDPIWGYSKDDAKIFKDGKLPAGYYASPAMVPGSEAEKRYKEDAAREGAHIPWESAAAPAPAHEPEPAKQAAQPAPAAPAAQPVLTLKK